MSFLLDWMEQIEGRLAFLNQSTETKDHAFIRLQEQKLAIAREILHRERVVEQRGQKIAQ